MNSREFQVIREEHPSDIESIKRVTVAAFSGSSLGHNGEAELVDAIREQGSVMFSFVAVRNNQTVGHALFSRARLELISESTGDAKTLSGSALGPMSVLPANQRQGVGKALIEFGLEKLSENGNPFTIVAGHPEYYSRFGFKPAQEFSLLHGFNGMPQDLFFINEGHDCDLQQWTGAAAYYCDAFGPQH